MFKKEYEVSNKRNLKGVLNLITKNTNVEISWSDKGVVVKGKEQVKVEIAGEIIKAIDLGFKPEDAIKIATEDHILYSIDVEEWTGKRINHKRRILGRVIGRNGSTKRTIEEMSKTHVIVDDRYIWILGHPEDVELAVKAFEKILEGRKHSTAYNSIRRKARWRNIERHYQLIYHM